MELDAVQLRVLGCLLEKQRTTPDAYPLTLNGLRLACNQATARDPVIAYDEAQIRDALAGLGRRRWTRLASGAGSRAPKYRHLLGDALGLTDAELALLCVLLLRGPQTPGELKQRSERLFAFPGLDAVIQTLDRLAERGLVAGLGRRPGQKEERYEQRLGEGSVAGETGESEGGAGAPAPAPAMEAAQPADSAVLERLAALERETAELRRRLDELRPDREG